jgi:hypothetical protein
MSNNKPVGWRGEQKRHHDAKVFGQASPSSKATSPKYPTSNRIEMPELHLDPQQKAENAIRSMFLSEQYKTKVPIKDIKSIFDNKRWVKMYGRLALVDAWASLVEEGYVIKLGDDYIWGAFWKDSPEVMKNAVPAGYNAKRIVWMDEALMMHTTQEQLADLLIRDYKDEDKELGRNVDYKKCRVGSEMFIYKKFIKNKDK